MCASTRSAVTSCDDLTASALHFLQPGLLERAKSKFGLGEVKDRPNTLDALARATLAELLDNALREDSAPVKAAREQLIADVRSRVERLDEDDRAKLLQSIDANELNDAAIRKILITGGGLAVFSKSVALAGFAAYILAAQVSAYVPLVTGPALVSFVAVLANPITVIAATAGVGWWATRSVDQRVRAEVCIRVLSLLALHGMNTGRAGIDSMLRAFVALPELTAFGDLKDTTLKAYRGEWEHLKGVLPKRFSLDPRIVTCLNRPAEVGEQSRAHREDLENTAALGILTLGDVLYCAYSIDPTVMQAAGFARATDLSDPVAFAEFAHKIEAMNPAANLGAISDVKGYVAERVVAAQFVAHGYQVEFPVASNQPGWDISVDGVRFQIKDDCDLHHIAQHFAEYGYEYPLIANSEVGRLLESHDPATLPEWANHVYCVEGYSNQVVEHVTRESIDAGDGMLHPHVPIFALAISTVRNYARLQRGEVTASQAFQQVLLDGGTRAGLAAIGGYAGTGIGLVVFGPAGALVLGGVVPILSQMQSRKLQGKLDEVVSSQIYRTWEIRARSDWNILVNKAREKLKTKSAAINVRISGLQQGDAAEYLRGRLNDDLCFLQETECRLDRLVNDRSLSIEVATARLLLWLGASTIHPSVYQQELAEFNAAFAKRPSLSERAADHAAKVVEGAKHIVRGLSTWWRRETPDEKDKPPK